MNAYAPSTQQAYGGGRPPVSVGNPPPECRRRHRRHLLLRLRDTPERHPVPPKEGNIHQRAQVGPTSEHAVHTWNSSNATNVRPRVTGSLPRTLCNSATARMLTNACRQRELTKALQCASTPVFGGARGERAPAKSMQRSNAALSTPRRASQRQRQAAHRSLRV